MNEQVQLILQTIPQRYPFLMIDRILEHKYKQEAICRKNVTHGEEILAGHFPENPIFPGVMMIEMGLQTTQVMLTDLETLKNPKASGKKAPQGYFLSVDRFKFLKVVRPGDVLRAKSTLKTEAMGMVRADIQISNENDEDVATGTVTVTAGAAESE